MENLLIRKYKKSDSTLISDFMKRCFLKDAEIEVRSHEPEYYRWKYEINPYAEPVAWVSEYKNKIVGLMSAIPRMMWLNGKEILVAESGDTFIDHDFRGQNIFMKLANKVYEDCRFRGFNFICGIPNPVSYPVMTKIFTYKPFFMNKSLIRPLNFDLIIQKKIPIHAISRSFGVCFEKVYNTIWNTDNDFPLLIKQVEKADDIFNQLWEKNKSFIKYGFLKNDKYVKWRFFDNPDKYEIYIISSLNEPVAWFAVKFNKIKGFLFAQIVDFIFPAGDMNLFKNYLSSVLRYCKDIGADFAEIWAISDTLIYSQLKKMGFLPRKKEFWFVIKENSMQLSKAMFDKTFWSYSQADSDNI